MPPVIKKIAITLTNGNLLVMSFVIREFRPDGSVRWQREGTNEEIEAEIARASLAGASGGWTAPVASWRLMNPNEIPEDRSFRDAWEDKDGKIGHNLPKAREIHLKRLRVEREPLLAAQDVEFTKALGKKDQKKADEVEAKRQKLRDLPQTAQAILNTATNIEEIKAVTIESLTT